MGPERAKNLKKAYYKKSVDIQYVLLMWRFEMLDHVLDTETLRMYRNLIRLIIYSLGRGC